MLIIDSGIKCPKDTTIPKSYLILALFGLSLTQSQQSMPFFSAYCLTGFPFPLYDVTTSMRLILEFLHFL